MSAAQEGQSPRTAEAGWSRIEELAREVQASQRAAAAAPILPARAGDVLPWPVPGSALHLGALLAGAAALREGAVAVVVLAGGAGTRFGGAVKGLVPVLGRRTFLDLKLEDAARVGARHGARVPVAIMTSPLTHGAIAAYLEEAGRRDVLLFEQRALPRLTLEGRVARGRDGRPSFAPAGHGDFFRALRESGVGAQLRARGVRHLAFSNVDNLGATLDPVVVGLHLQLGAAMTVEVAARCSPSGTLDAGAAPVRVGGRLQLVEKVEARDHPLISTNNFLFELAPLLERTIALPWRAVRKDVDGATVLQLEQVTAEATGLLDDAGEPVLPAAYVEVPRQPAADSRFEPVKTREDLERVAARLGSRLEGGAAGPFVASAGPPAAP